MNSENLLLYFFISIGLSFLLTRLFYILYLNSIGLEYNPNKKEYFMGSYVKKYYNIPTVIDTYLETEKLDEQQKKILIRIKYWEYMNFALLISFPLVAILSTMIF